MPKKERIFQAAVFIFIGIILALNPNDLPSFGETIGGGLLNLLAQLSMTLVGAG